MINHTVNANVGQNFYIQATSTDNAVNIKGQTVDGHVNHTILKDDPEFDAKINDLITEMETFQKAKIQEQTTKALENYDNSLLELKNKIEQI